MIFNMEFNIQSYWHIGSGAEGGAYADALVLKDNQQLPYLPGKSIKGLLRDAFTRAEKNQWFNFACTGPDPAEQYSLVDLLFGNENNDGTTNQGILQISSAVLSSQEKNYLSQYPQAKSQLYKVTYSTAIDEETGVAKNTSLRSMEVSVPMLLTAQVAINKTHPEFIKNQSLFSGKLDEWLAQVVIFITELGAKRHRGLGKVVVNVKQEQ
jgi:CRISPR/Cas system CSM-associated protein Csm3 (group 7 of RAMP superfamily)